MSAIMALAMAASGAVLNCSSADKSIKSSFVLRLVPDAVHPKRAFVEGQLSSFDVDRPPLDKWKARSEEGRIFVSRDWKNLAGVFDSARIELSRSPDTAHQWQFFWNTTTGARGGHIVLEDEGNGVCSLVPNTMSNSETMQ